MKYRIKQIGSQADAKDAVPAHISARFNYSRLCLGFGADGDFFRS